MSKNIKLVIGSTRNNRKAEKVANWLVDQAKAAGHNLEILDLRDMKLPMFEAPASPMYVDVDTPEARNWAKTIADSEGLIFLTAEHNRSIPASLKSAIDYLFKEWEGKPTAVVSYGYIDGGKSATKHLQDILNWVKVSLVEPTVAIMFTQETFDNETGEFVDADKSLMEYKDDFLKAIVEIENA